MALFLVWPHRLGFKGSPVDSSSLRPPTSPATGGQTGPGRPYDVHPDVCGLGLSRFASVSAFPSPPAIAVSRSVLACGRPGFDHGAASVFRRFPRVLLHVSVSILGTGGTIDHCWMARQPPFGEKKPTFEDTDRRPNAAKSSVQDWSRSLPVWPEQAGHRAGGRALGAPCLGALRHGLPARREAQAMAASSSSRSAIWAPPAIRRRMSSPPRSSETPLPITWPRLRKV